MTAKKSTAQSAAPADAVAAYLRAPEDGELDLPAAAYLRVSKTGDRDDEQLDRHALGEQRELIGKFLPRGAGIIDEYLDKNRSGKGNAKRPEMDRLFEDVREGRVKIVMVGYLSRFGRSARELLQNVQFLHDHGVTFYSARESLIVTPETRGAGKLLLTVLAAVAEMELDRLTETLGRANRKSLEDGISVSIPFGYRRANGPGSGMVFNDETTEDWPSPAEIVRRIYAEAAAGVGWSDLAAGLNADGIPAPRGGKWRHNTISGLVATKTYRGVIPRTLPDGGVEELPGQHPALIDGETWHRANARRTSAVRNGTTGNALLRGLVRCEGCSHTMTPSQVKSRGDKRYLIYRCVSGRKGCPRPASMDRARVDEYVVSEAFSGLGTMEKSREAHRLALTEAEIALTDAQDELEAFALTASAVDLGDAYPIAVRAKLTARDAAASEVARIRAEAGARTVERDEFDDLPIDEQRVILNSLLDCVVIEKATGQGVRGVVEERVTLVWRGQAPADLPRTGRPGVTRPFPLDGDMDGHGVA